MQLLSTRMLAMLGFAGTRPPNTVGDSLRRRAKIDRQLAALVKILQGLRTSTEVTVMCWSSWLGLGSLG
eukprot:6771507-Alexandrium_andersonii.AAC.1